MATGEDVVARLGALLAAGSGVTGGETPDHHLASRNGPTRPCAQCGRPVDQYVYLGDAPSERAYCSPWCRQDYWNGRAKAERAARRQKSCPVCGEAFAGTRADQVTCSAACRQKAYRQRKGGA